MRSWAWAAWCPGSGTRGAKTARHAEADSRVRPGAGRSSFSHPDCHGRPRNCTGSAQGTLVSQARGLYRRWGLAPRPEGKSGRDSKVGHFAGSKARRARAGSPSGRAQRPTPHVPLESQHVKSIGNLRVKQASVQPPVTPYCEIPIARTTQVRFHGIARLRAAPTRSSSPMRRTLASRRREPSLAAATLLPRRDARADSRLHALRAATFTPP